MASVTGFLLTRHWRDGPDGVELVFWAHSSAGPLRLVFRGQRAVCFTPADTALDPADLPGLRLERKHLGLHTLDGRPVDGLYFYRQRDLRRLRAHATEVGIPLYESDIKPHDRFLMERFITAPLEVVGDAVERRGYLAFHNPAVRPAACDPCLSYVSLDIETDGIDTLRDAFRSFASFELGFVAERLLGRRKLIAEPAGKSEEIRCLFREDRPAESILSDHDRAPLLVQGNHVHPVGRFEYQAFKDLLIDLKVRNRLRRIPLARAIGSTAEAREVLVEMAVNRL